MFLNFQVTLPCWLTLECPIWRRCYGTSSLPWHVCWVCMLPWRLPVTTRPSDGSSASLLACSSISHWQLWYVQYNSIQVHNTIWYDTIQSNTIQSKTIRYYTITYDTIQNNTSRYNSTRYDTIRYNTINAIRYNTIENNELCCCTLYQIKSDSNQCNTIQFNETKYSTTKCTNTTLTYTAVQFIISYNNKRIIRHDTTPTRTAPHHPTPPHTPSHTPPHYTT